MNRRTTTSPRGTHSFGAGLFHTIVVVCLSTGTSFAQPQIAWSSFTSHASSVSGSSIHLTSSVGQLFNGESYRGSATVTSGSFAQEMALSLTGVTGVAAEDEIPRSFDLGQNYPNPFNPTTTIRYDLPTRGNVVIQIYTILGQRVRTLVQSEMEAGTHQILWDGRDDAGTQVGSGVFLYRMVGEGYTSVRKMMLLR